LRFLTWEENYNSIRIMEGEKGEKKMIKMIWKRIGFIITKLVIWPF